ncbi:MAG TPA: hypothetical protein VN023_09545 [Methylovorus sp.]|nr:hypothetical protein [Methylovorus sp.]
MPKIQTVQTNFTAGELSQRLGGRIDIARWNNAARELENCHPVIQGGAKDRGGSLFVKATKNANKLAVLFPFIYNRSQAYVLEFGDFYMRVYANGGQVEASPSVAYEIATPYPEAVLRQVTFVQSADTMFLMHESYPVQRLRRFGNADWRIEDTPFELQPFDEVGVKPAIALTLSAATVGTGRTATLASGYWLAADVGREIVFSTGVAKITAVGSATSATVTITSVFPSTSLASGTWTLDGSPVTICTPSIKDPVGADITLTLTAAGWRAADVGKVVKINKGVVQITAFSSSTVVTGTIKVVLSSTTAAAALSWTLNDSIWGPDDRGYPRTGTFFEQRLILAGSPGRPESAAASVTGEYLNFLLGTDDDHGFLFRIAESRDQIFHLAKVRRMLALSPGGEFSITGGVEKPITPTSIQISGQSEEGCSSVRPLRVGNELYFVHGSGKMLLATSYKFDVDGFDATEVSKTAEHIAIIGIIEMSYKRSPDSLIWVILANGQMASLTVDKAEAVSGWARHITDGEFESVCTIPVSGGEETWVIVKRTINGTVKRYVERMQPDIKMDSAIIGTSGPGAAIWTGLDHLEGKDVVVLADGLVAGTFTVSGGQIDIIRPAHSVTIGLKYTPKIKMLPPLVSGSTGTNQGKQTRTGRIVIRVLDTIGLDVDGQTVPFRNYNDLLIDQPLLPYTGDVEVGSLGWLKNGAEIEITQPDPLPMHVLAVFRDVTVND